jgi:hypothetical protein
MSSDSGRSLNSENSELDDRDNNQRREIRRKKPIPLLDEITLGPIEKYTKFNVFPWGFLLHIGVLAVVIAQILLVIVNLGIYTRSQVKIWYNIFQDNEVGDIDVNFNGIQNIYNIGDLSDHIKECIEKYYNIDEKYYKHIMEIDEATEEERITPVVFETFYLRGGDREFFSAVTQNLTNEDFGIWGEPYTEIQRFLNRTTNFRLTYYIEHPLPSEHLFADD